MTTQLRAMAAVLVLGLAVSASAQTKAPARAPARAPAAPPAKAPATPQAKVPAKPPAKGAPAEQPADAPTQTPAPATPAPGTPDKPAVQLPSPPQGYVYSTDGRRDPFVSLINHGNDPRGKGAVTNVKRGEGAAGIMTGELVVKGIMENRGQFMAMVAGADKKVYTVRPGDRLADGVVRTVTPEAVVILQEVNDPLSLEKQREVRKFLRGGDVK